jgi:hypothetical protein
MLETEIDSLLRTKEFLAKNSAKKYARLFGKRHYKDFLQEARILLYHGIKEFIKSEKKDKDKTMDSYLSKIIKNGLSKIALKYNSDFKVSVSTREQVNRINKLIKEGYLISDISKKLQISVKRINRLIKYNFNFYRPSDKSAVNICQDQKVNYNNRMFEILDGLNDLDKEIFTKICENKTISDIVSETGLQRYLVRDRLLVINDRIKQNTL